MRSGFGVITLYLLTTFFSAACAAEPLTGDEIRKRFEGNTLSGRYMDGKPFSEFHHLDGRVLGHNRFVPNTDACWITTESHVCYYYGTPKERQVFCSRVDQGERLYLLKRADDGDIIGVGTLEPGNPRNHADNGVRWHCDGNIVQRPSGLREEGKLAMTED